MFTRAGFNADDAVPICGAMIHRRGWAMREYRWSFLFRFATSGEYAWFGSGGASWPERVFVGGWLDRPRVDAPRTALPR